MASYCVNNSNAQDNGDHEVHNLDAGCSNYPDPGNQVPLGEHATCATAVEMARAIEDYKQSNGCFYCANECHTT